MADIIVPIIGSITGGIDFSNYFEGDTLSFANSYDYGCRVRMQRIGPWLLIWEWRVRRRRGDVHRALP